MDPAEYPARAARQWIPPRIPPELPVDPAEYPAERLASGSRRVSRQSGSPVDPAEYPAEYRLPVDPAEYPASIEPERLAVIRQWIPPVSPEQLASLVLLDVPPGAQRGCLRVLSVP